MVRLLLCLLVALLAECLSFRDKEIANMDVALSIVQARSDSDGVAYFKNQASYATNEGPHEGRLNLDYVLGFYGKTLPW